MMIRERVRQIFIRRPVTQSEQDGTKPVRLAPSATLIDLDLAPNDPLVVYLQSSPGVVELDKLLISSPALTALKAAGVKLTVPLVSQGELIGLINLGPRLSEQDYSSDDRKLLQDLAAQAAPAVRVAQLARQQQLEARERERLEQELRVARLIQQTLLPQDVPHVPGYQVAAYYQPAREVGGDFYDFLYFEDGKVGLVIGDVTDKGVPAALVMATTRTLLRAAAERLVNPGATLQRVNELLVPDIPPRMFVTCLYALLDPATGLLRFANAGHDLPYRRGTDGVNELRATGMPLGLMPGMTYEEKEVSLLPGDTVLFYSDGLAEAHNPAGDMFGFPRVQACLAAHEEDSRLVDYLVAQLEGFTGSDWIQEDDVTLVTLHHNPPTATDPEQAPGEFNMIRDWQSLAAISVPSAPGNERQAITEVVSFVGTCGLTSDQLEKLKTAVGEATMNAMEHGNKYAPDLPVEIEILSATNAVAVRITDQGEPFLVQAETPDLEAKLAGLQSPRGWGLFLIQNMVDEMNVYDGDGRHTVELVMHLEEGTS